MKKILILVLTLYANYDIVVLSNKARAKEENDMEYEFTFYVGLNDKDSKVQEISTIEAYKLCMKTIQKFADGGTIFEADGFYTHDNGEVVIEKTLRIEVLFITESVARQIVSELKTKLNQESIAVTQKAITSQLW